MKKCLSMLTGILALTTLGNPVSNETLLRLPPMPKVPVIDGKISQDEWKYASTTFGGISTQTGLMTRRENNFRFGYDAKNLYFAITSEIPVAPQTLTHDDKVEFHILPPGGQRTVVIVFDSKGKGKLPANVVMANGIAASLMNAEKGKCWNAELSVPLASLGVSAVKDGEKWGLQMIRHWSNQKETGYWHKPTKSGELGTFIPDSKAPVVSFDGFGLHYYASTGNYRWTYRVENPGKQKIGILSESYRMGVEGAPTLDINNPDLFGKAEKVRIGYSKEVEAGATAYFQLYQMAQFPGKPRLLFSELKGYNKVTYYRRTMFWDVIISQRAAIYKDGEGLPYLNVGFYPSFGNKLRIAVSFNKKRPCGMAVVTVKDAKGKTLHTFTKSGFGRVLEDFEDETVLPRLPLGDYTVTLVSSAMDGRKFSHTRTFSIREFPWQNLNIGKERVIVPPFKPLQVDKNKQEVRALMTGYKIGGGLWNAIYAEGENILSAPVQFFLNGKPLFGGNTKLVSAEKDRVVYETTIFQDKVKLILHQDYDYDGFCKLTAKVIPQGTVKVKSFELRIPLKNDVVKYYNSLNSNHPRAKGKPDYTISPKQGELELSAIQQKKGRVLPYFWFGGLYKGFSWIIDTQRHYSLDTNHYAQKLVRNGKAVTFIQHIVNRPTEWSKPFEIVMGFEPTPVKPQAQEYRRISQYMYDYDPAKGSDIAGGMHATQWPLGYSYPINALPDGDDGYYKYILNSRNRTLTAAERRKAGEEYIARHKTWLQKNAPLTNLDGLMSRFTDKRTVGDKYFLMYHNPAFYSCRWPEAEMYKAEWLPWDYPVDDAQNEYIACQTPEYIDKMLYEMRYQTRLGFDGMNFDCFPLGGGFNTVTMGAFREKPGPVPFIINDNMLQIAPYGISGCNNLFGWRELMKRTAHMLYTEKKLTYGVPWVELHSTNVAAVPVTSFCSTVITTECGARGGEFQDRFPEGYVLGDLAGTQSGVIPRPIVSTNAAVKGVSVDDEVKSLISFSFAYGLMNHSDQGVRRGYKDYQTARDAVFSFGYGRPENKTLTFYGKEKQPVICKAKDIRTTQVIRPDGRALLMIGNLGEKVLAEFDLSGLKYGKCQITDVFTGKILSSAKIEIPRRGYALLKIEKIKTKG